jgi:hypothetical protein
MPKLLKPALEIADCVLSNWVLELAVACFFFFDANSLARRALGGRKTRRPFVGMRRNVRRNAWIHAVASRHQSMFHGHQPRPVIA